MVAVGVIVSWPVLRRRGVARRAFRLLRVDNQRARCRRQGGSAQAELHRAEQVLLLCRLPRQRCPSRRAGRPARMADVAKVAGVSHQTVSRVLNDFPKIRPATRDRVLAAIEELGYRRNIAARTLVTRPFADHWGDHR